ncbi:MAG TPA: NmrA/HSCARG family protein [Candidatus Lokiarchaeia archaeon]|nr:NmrA/HSCARG family protein [Candidatus Lokiarchaeia archaeon]
MSLEPGSRILVTGATGRQGGAAVRALLKKEYQVRAFTRDMNAPNALAIKALGAEVVRGNFFDPATIAKALKNVDGIFTMTTSFEGGVEAEVQQGMNMIEAAKQAGIKHFVMTSVASANLQTGIPHFDSKYAVEQALEEAGIPYTIIAPVSFMENMLGPMALPNLKSCKVVMFQEPEVSQQLIAVSDIGEMATSIIARGEEVFGKRFDIASDDLTGNQIVEILTKATGRDFEYIQRDPSDMGMMPPDFAKMSEWIVRVGYSVDIPALHEQFSEVPWHTFESWVNEQDWDLLLRENEDV